MNQLGDAPTDMLFGLMALHNDLVAPAVIPAALKAQAREPERTLAELLVSQGALSPTLRDLIESLSGEYVNRHGGDTKQSLATLLEAPSTRQRLDRLGDPELFRSLGATVSRGSDVTAELDFQLNDQERTLLPSTTVDTDSRSRIAGYEILEVLGAGGMGIVYKARQARLDRFVALKMIRAGAGARPEDLARFEIEAKAVAAIEHPNIVQIFDIGEHDGLPYFSLEYLAGGNLAQKIGGKPQPVRECRPDRRDPRPCDVLCTPAQGDPPRLETEQCPPRRRWHSQDHRLRAGQAARRRFGTDPLGLGPGDAQLHGSRAGMGRHPEGRARLRPVCPGRHPLRALDRPAAVSGSVGPRNPRHGPQPGAGAPVAAPEQDAPRPGDNLSQVPGKGHRPPLPRCPGPRRRLAQVPGGRDHPGASGFRHRAGLALVRA